MVIIVLLEFFLEVLLVEKFFWEFWVFVEFGIDWLELGVFICVDVFVIGFTGFEFIVLIFVLFVIFFGIEIFLEILVEEFFLVVIWIFLLILLVLDVKELFEVDFVIVDIDLFEGLDVDLLVLVGLIFKILGFIVFFFLVFGFVLLFFEFFVILFVFFEIEDLVGWRYDGVDDFWLIVMVEIKVLLFVSLLGGIGFIFFIVFVEDWVVGFCILIFFSFDLSVSILDLFLVNFFLDFLSFLFFFVDFILVIVGVFFVLFCMRLIFFFIFFLILESSFDDIICMGLDLMLFLIFCLFFFSAFLFRCLEWIVILFCVDEFFDLFLEFGIIWIFFNLELVFKFLR